MSNTLELLLSLITTTTPALGTTSTVPELCGLVDTTTGVPLYCEPRPDDAPIYDGNVCCIDGSCTAATSRCEPDSLFYCDRGERRTDGGVSCYFLVPRYCEVYSCAGNVEYDGPSPSTEHGMCCHEGICWHHTIGSNDCELEDIMWCSDGVSNPDGTVTCLDDE